MWKRIQHLQFEIPNTNNREELLIPKAKDIFRKVKARNDHYVLLAQIIGFFRKFEVKH